MMWLVWAITSAVFWAIGNVLMKRAVGKMPKELVYLANALFFWIFWIILLAVQGNFSWNWLATVLALFPGLGFIYALTALAKADASLVSAIGSINPAITAVLAVSFLGEKLNIWQTALISLVVLGAIYMALPDKIKGNRAWVWWGIGFGLLSGLNNFFNKVGMGRVSTISYTLVVASWQLLTAIIWVSVSRQWNNLGQLFKKEGRVGLSGTGIFNLGSVAFFTALGLGQASLVMPVVNLYVPLICILAWWWLGERMTVRQMVGATVIIISVIGLSIFT